VSYYPHYLLSAAAGFSAAHTLPGGDMCQRFHGRNWHVCLAVRISEGRPDETGRGVDFREIQRVARDVVYRPA
jgi:6-pyruvoyl-tetrahydropterin synthase